MKQYYHKIILFLTHDIWRLDSTAFGQWKRRGMRYLKVLLLTIRSMSTHKVGIQAAALTFFSLLALIPFIAVVYAITKGFGFTAELESMIYANFSEQEEIVQWILTFANNFLNTSKSGFFSIIGSLTFFWSVIWVMISVEQAFNHVWQVKNDHSIARKALIYFGLILLSPALIGGLLMIPLSYNDLIQRFGFNIKIFTSLTPIVGWLILFSCVGALVFLAFKWIPNTKVRSLPCFHAAIITTIGFVLIQALYMETQLFVSKLNAVYGAFAAIPFFMLWMNMNWFLILLGAELSYAFQNIDLYHYGHHKS